jgi:hypothetical protein
VVLGLLLALDIHSRLYYCSTEGVQDDDDDTASEDGSDEGSEDEEEGDDESGSDEDTKHAAKATRKAKVDAGYEKVGMDVESSDESEGSDNDEEDEDDSYEEKVVDYSREKDLASKVLERVMASSKTLELDEAQPHKTVEIEGKQTVKGTKSPAKETKTIETTATVKEVKKSEATEPARKNKKVEPVAESSQEDGLKRTVFVRNLPLEAKVQDLRRQFSDFGEVKSFRLVLHPITKYARNEYSSHYFSRGYICGLHFFQQH